MQDVGLTHHHIFIADAICGIGLQQPAPTHMLKQLRELKKNKINEFISILTESIGIERATPSLLSRMLKSTIGFFRYDRKKSTFYAYL